jgi:tetratricopeptide (TPR) repeat protein
MAERIDEPESQADPGAGPISPVAGIAIGLRKGKAREKPDPKLDAFLDEQTRFVRLQAEHLHEQRELQLAHLKVRRWKDRLSLALQGLGIALGLAIAVIIALLAWQAHEDHGLVVEAFSVPPDFAARGVTGEVAAGRLLDKLADMQSRTVSARPARSYQNNWGEDAKVEIPETGVTLGELVRWLHDTLGSQTRVSGEVFRTPKGLTVSVRAGQDAASFSGPEADLDKLMQQAAEAVYRRSQPYRYALWLIEAGRRQEGLAAMSALADGPVGPDRRWADSVALYQLSDGDVAGALARVADARRLFPGYSQVWMLVTGVDNPLDREQEALEASRRGYAVLRQKPDEMTDVTRQPALLTFQVNIADLLGDARTGVELDDRIAQLPDYSGSVLSAQADMAVDQAMAHDAAGADATLAHDKQIRIPQPVLLFTELQDEALLERWSEAAKTGQALLAMADNGQIDSSVGGNVPIRRFGAAMAAYALARRGEVAAAQRLIGTTPLDCYTCVRLRGGIAAVSHDAPDAQRWFAEAVRGAPDIPMAYVDWAKLRLAQGDVKGAIAKLAIAHQKAPHYADALEFWGEALMAVRDDVGAVSKFAEADRDAPRWGRNHMRWGEALMLSGRYREARAQFEAAEGLDLSGPDRAGLNVLLARTASGPLHG